MLGAAYTFGMKPPLFVRELTDAERDALRAGPRSPDAFAHRRAQTLLASAAGKTPPRIAAELGCASQTFRDVIRAFAAEGVGCLVQKSKAAKTDRTAWPRERDADLRGLLHASPRTHGQPTSLWTLALVAKVCHELGWTDRELSGETIRQVLKRLGVGWKRAKRWLTSPDPDYAAKENAATS